MLRLPHLNTFKKMVEIGHTLQIRKHIKIFDSGKE